ncbi:MAG: lecithin retinol acyltransferase family protein [Clostridia bacterium]|nr:lecithin retinol acyltransferase family protein [Clostridia bacterium]
MKWILGEPQSGDMIRVQSGTIYHYGIYVSDDEVIQFGLAPNARPTVKDADIEVLATDIDVFLAGRFLEVAEFDRKEKKVNRSSDEVISIARARMGERGYHILYNNCEHFAYECVTGKHYSEQVDGVREIFKGLFGKKKE